MRRIRIVVLLITALALVGVACGQSSSDSTSTSSAVTTAPSASTEASTPASTTATSSAESSTTSTSGASTTAATTPAEVSCVGVETLAATEDDVLTFVSDGKLWAVSDGVTCLVELPAQLAALDYSWGPAGDKVLFADGTILAADANRPEVTGADASLGWTRPTGTSTVHVSADGTLHKVSVADGTDTTMSPLARHDAIAYHPDGTTFAVSGSDGVEDGIWISKNDGTEPQAFAFADLGVVIPEMRFTNDARWLVFVADHRADLHDDGYHLHSVYTEPVEFEDGTMALNSASEFGATTHLISDVPLDTIVVPGRGSGFSDVPNGFAVAQGECGPDRRALFVPHLNDSEDVVPLSDQPSQPVGFLWSDDGDAHVVIATSADGCSGPFELHLVTVDTTTFSTSTSLIAGDVTAAAVKVELPVVDITLSGVVIEPFA